MKEELKESTNSPKTEELEIWLNKVIQENQKLQRENEILRECLKEIL